MHVQTGRAMNLLIARLVCFRAGRAERALSVRGLPGAVSTVPDGSASPVRS